MNKQTVALWAIGLLPLSFLGAGIASGVLKEYRARKDLLPFLNDVLSSQKLGLSELEQMDTADFAERQNLAEVFYSLNREASRDEISGPLGQWKLVAPKASWDAAPLYARLSKKAVPAINRLEKMQSESNQNSSAAHLLDGVNHVLQVALIDAFYRSDFDEAYRLFCLLANQTATRPIDDEVNAQLIALREQFIFNALIQDSLQYDPWTQTQLDGLTKLIETPVELKERLRSAMRRQIASFSSIDLSTYNKQHLLESKAGPLDWPPNLGAVRLKHFIEVANTSIDLSAVNDYEQIYSAILKEDKSLRAEGAFSPTMPGKHGDLRWFLGQVRKLAIAISQTEDMRRMTATAIEIKQYQERKGEWPDDLSDIYPNNRVPLSAMMIGRIPFKFTTNGREVAQYALLDCEGSLDIPRVLSEWPRWNVNVINQRLLHDVTIR